MKLRESIAAASGYKPSIDGLRAVSILAVVAYHLGLIKGGFVGVDVFFVISGFLIITHIVGAIESGSFRFGEFWARRALRILPPYFLVLAASYVLASVILVLPKELYEFGWQATYSAAMMANHYFLGQQGYFDGAPDTKPLLHLWSLAVEEQFYFVAPIFLFLLLAACKRIGRRRARTVGTFVVALVFVLTLYWCIQLSGGGAGKNYSFFLMPLRIWEFIAGGIVALLIPVARQMPRLVMHILALLGISLIVGSALTYSGANPYPAALAFAPVIGAAMVTLCGVASPSNFVARVLSLKPVVWVGLVSYGWYLWHWVFLSFGRIYNFGQRDLFFDSVMVALALGAAWLTYAFVDQKVLAWRNRQTHLGWRQVLYATLLCAPMFGIGVAFSGLVAPSVRSNLTVAQIPRAPAKSEHCDLHAAKSAVQCKADSIGKRLGLLVGDSHADAAYRQLSAYSMDSGAILATMSSGGCVGLFGVHVNNPDQEMQRRCEDGRRNAFSLLGQGLAPKFAIVFSSWTLYTGRGFYSLAESGSNVPFPRTEKGFISKMHETIATLRDMGVERILVVGPVPTFRTRAPSCVLRSDRYSIDRDKHCSIPREAVDAARENAVQWLSLGVANDPRTRFLDPIDAFCDPDRCRSYDASGVLYTDTNHISDAGMKAIYAKHRDAISWVLADPESINTAGQDGAVLPPEAKNDQG